MTIDFIATSNKKIKVKEISKNRLEIDGLQGAIIDGLAYLIDTHVYDPSNYRISPYNFIISSQKKTGKGIRFFAWLRSFIGNKIVNEKHLKGTWPGFIHYMPNVLKTSLKPLLVVTDYNLFTTASIVYALFLFDERQLPENNKPIKKLLDNVNQVISDHKRGSAYNFWKPRFNRKLKMQLSAPLNLPIFLIDLRWHINRLTGFLGLKKFNEADRLFKWVADCYDKNNNVLGGKAMVHIPNDVDNSSMAVIFQILFKNRFPESKQKPDIHILDLFSKYRDINRKKVYENNKILKKNTGAFLTWLKDENLPDYSKPEDGIIPLNTNNLDAVINSNVLYALSISEKQSMPGYQDSVKFIVETIESGVWHKANVYYPQKMIIPCTISRAWRDAEIKDKSLENALTKLLIQLIDEQAKFETNNPEFKGAFPNDKNDCHIHTTALGLLTFLNLGEKTAKKADKINEFRKVVDNAVLFLLNNRESTKIQQKNTAKFFPGAKPCYWKSGLLYSASMEELAHWYSNAQVTSLVIEALTKYAINYDNEDQTFLSKQLVLKLVDGNVKLSEKTP